jgi:N-acetylglucosaminyldiphosphoundecaprenol N-acetyl-beta-D-mannosaminyltransferase
MAKLTSIGQYRCGKLNVSALGMTGAIDIFFNLIAAKRGGYIACVCTHGVVEVERDSELRRILNAAALSLPDGMPLVWLGRLKGVAVARVAATNFLEGVMRDPRGRTIRHYFYGGDPQVVARVAERAQKLIGSDAVVGWHSPAYRPAGAAEEPDQVAAMVNVRPDVIWVGLGLPKQEYWMAKYAEQFPSTILIGVGAAFDFFAGAQPRAPAFMQRVGLEWLHRLLTNPARLWRRYLNVVPKALAILGKEAMSKG